MLPSVKLNTLQRVNLNHPVELESFYTTKVILCDTMHNSA